MIQMIDVSACQTELEQSRTKLYCGNCDTAVHSLCHSFHSISIFVHIGPHCDQLRSLWHRCAQLCRKFPIVHSCAAVEKKTITWEVIIINFTRFQELFILLSRLHAFFLCKCCIFLIYCVLMCCEIKFLSSGGASKMWLFINTIIIDCRLSCSEMKIS